MATMVRSLPQESIMILSRQAAQKRHRPGLVSWALRIACSACGAYIAASVFHSLFLLRRIESVGLVIPPMTWIKVIGENLWAMAFDALFYSYALMIQIGFIIAQPIAIFVSRKVRLNTALVCSVAGAVAIATILHVSRLAFHGYTLLAGAQTTAGYVFQLLAGALGGALFAFLERCKRHQDGSPM